MGIERRTVQVMSVACAVSVANLYYSQPLLADIAQSLGAAGSRVAYLPMFTQAGTALGMLAFVPLGDMLPRRRLISIMCCAMACAGLLMALAPSLAVVNVAGFLTGLTTIVPHLVLPFAAKLADDKERGRVVGQVLGGLLTGILLARVVSGYVGDVLGWRAMYLIASASMFTLAVALHYLLPFDRPHADLSYGELLRSIGKLVAREPLLREAALTGGMLFGAFSSFWATLVFFLGAAPYRYGARVAGLFGIVGLAGALIAPRAGRLTDRRGPAFTLTLAILTTIASWVVFGLGGHILAVLILGVVLLDLGVQAGHVANQTRIYALLPEARSRLNTVYMVSYFMGGAAGSAMGAWGWEHYGWTGVCVAGGTQGVVALIVRMSGTKTQARLKNLCVTLGLFPPSE
jgi:predicted MFS family arabinose efflux permease